MSRARITGAGPGAAGVEPPETPLGETGAPGPHLIDLRGPGRWEELLEPELQVDAVITDVPYLSRAMSGFRSGAAAASGKAGAGKAVAYAYEPWTLEEAEAFADLCVRAARWWVVAFGCHETFHALESLFQARGWVTFAPVAWWTVNGPPRFAADGPANGLEWILVARPRHRVPRARSGSRPGVYRHRIVNGGSAEKVVTGGKPLALMRAIVRDYTLPGDVVLDPFCGGATTAIAAAQEGCRAITVEENPETYEAARRRVAAGWTPELVTRGPRPPAPKALRLPGIDTREEAST